MGKNTNKNKICKTWLNILKKEELKLQKESVKTLKKYSNKYNDENIDLLINYVENNNSSTKRSDTFGHITASSIIISKGKMLLIFHKTLKMFIQPGGHLENDTSLWEAAKREAIEETGLDVELHEQYGDIPVYIDIQEIPENKKKQELAHTHFDCMFVFKSKNEQVKLQEGEVSDYKWVPLDSDFENIGIKCVIDKINKSNL